MDKVYFSNNDQEGVFEPTREEHEEVVETKAPVEETPVKEKRTERYYTNTIAPSVRRIVTPSAAYQDEYTASNVSQVIYFVAGILNILLGVRFLFKLFGAASTGIVSAVYSLTEPLVAPLRGIFHSSSVPQAGVFEVESILAILAVSILAYLLVGLLRMMTQNTPVE